MASHQLLLRGSKGCYVRAGPLAADPYTFNPSEQGTQLPTSKLEVEYSQDGSMVLILGDSAVVVCDTASGKEISKLACNGALAASFSPQGTFILTWEKLTDELQKSGGNLRIWRTATGEFLSGFGQKQFSKDAWPYVQWTSDEMIAAMAISNGIHWYNGQDFSKGVIGKIELEKIKAFQISPGPAPYKMVTFVAEHKDKPASAKLWAYPKLDAPVSSKTMFRANDCQIAWSPTGLAALVKTTTDVDATGNSYYGESKLYFLSSDGKMDGNVSLSKDGPIHDIAWSPGGKEFVVAYGQMPAKATLFDLKCDAKFDFGTGSRNTVRWSPHGRFLLLGGFGNISGHVEFWDNNRKKQMAQFKAPGTTNFSWSPCSRFFLCATLFPRLRVDNGFKLFKYDGKLIHEEKLPAGEELYQITWRPAKQGTFPDRPASPGAGTGVKDSGSSASGGQEGGAYVPPHLRGKQGAAAARPAFSLHDYEAASKVGGGSALGSKALPPGASEEDNKLSKSALKKKKAKEKAQREKDEAEALEETQRALAAAGIEAPAAAASAGAASGAGPGAGEDKTYSTPQEVEKRIKAVQKKLRQAESLAEDAASGKELNVDQKAKIDSIGAVKAELEELNQKLKSLQ